MVVQLSKIERDSGNLETPYQIFSMVIVEHFEIIFDHTICKKYHLINHCNIMRDDSQEYEYILTLNKVSYVIRSYYNCQVKLYHRNWGCPRNSFLKRCHQMGSDQETFMKLCEDF